MQTAEITRLVRQALEDMKAIDAVIIDVRELSSVSDSIIICSGRSDRHVKSIAKAIVEMSKKHGAQPLSVEGMTHGEWVLVDLADVVVHVMKADIRTFYDLESLWQVPAEKNA